MFETVCPTDRVKTVPARVLHEPSEGLAASYVVAERYEIVRPLGQGAMGVVYLAKQLSVGRRVALKLMSRDLLRGGSEGVRRFHQEAAQASQLEHPNIVRIHDFGVDDALELPFIAMEYVEGETLQDILRRGPRSVGYTVAVVSQVARALTAAHAAGIVHRDLKPENVMVGALPGGELHATVLDFGIAKTLRTPQGVKESLTASGIIIGTPRYMSPEQVLGEDVDARSDLYALGCILHEMLEGQPPFAADDPTGVMLKHVHALVPPLSAVGDGPHPLAELHDALLAKKPVDRPASAEAVRRVLADLSTSFDEGTERRAQASSSRSGTNLSEGRSASGSGANPGALRAASVPGAVPSSAPESSPGPEPTQEPDDAMSQTLVRPRRMLRDPPQPGGSLAPRRARWLGVAAVAGIAAGVGGGWLLSPGGDDLIPEPGSREAAPEPRADLKPAFVHPLADRRSILACPLWKAAGVDEPSGWLGAAAAFAACERAQWLLGGRVERTLVPAELLGFPSLPGDDFPEDPYADPALLERSLAAARQRGAVWLEGTIRLVELGRLTARLRVMTEAGQIGEVIEAEGRAPFEAAWSAIDAAVSTEAMPKQPLDPEVAQWWMLPSVEWALIQAEADERASSGLGLQELCPKAELPEAPPRLLDLKGVCQIATTSPVAGVASDATVVPDADGPSFVWFANAALYDAQVAASVFEQATRGREESSTAIGRFLYGVAQSASAVVEGSSLAPTLLRRLLLEFPRARLNLRQMYRGVSGQPSGQLTWEPASPSSGRGSPFRAFVLAGSHLTVNRLYSERWGRTLVAEERFDEALDLAAHLLSGHPVQRTVAIVLQARVAAAQGRISGAADILASLSDEPYCPPCWALFRQFHGLSAEFDQRSRREARRICDSGGPGGPTMRATVAPHLLAIGVLLEESGAACFRAFDRWLETGPGNTRVHLSYPRVAACRDGAKAWLEGRRAEAVARWRGVSVKDHAHVCPVPTSLVADLDPDLAATWDTDRSDAWDFGGAHPADVRAFQAATRRGDEESAVRLAEKVVTAWKGADLRIPVLDEMRSYLEDRRARGAPSVR
jgi:serine/threonine-protein kinase